MMTPFGTIPDASLHLSCDLDTAPPANGPVRPVNCNSTAVRDAGTNAGEALISIRVTHTRSRRSRRFISNIIGALEQLGMPPP